MGWLGLVGQAHMKRHALVHTANGQSFFSASDFTQASEQLVADGHGTIKDGYEAIKVAISGLIFSRSYNLVRHIILITGSDRTQGKGLTKESIKRDLINSGAVLNVVVDNTFLADGSYALGVGGSGIAYVGQSGGAFRRTTRNVGVGVGAGYTRVDYTQLALDTNGTAWDINILRSGGDRAKSFTSALVASIIEETRQKLAVCKQCVCRNDNMTKVCHSLPDNTECAGNGSKLQVRNSWDVLGSMQNFPKQCFHLKKGRGRDHFIDVMQ